MAASLEETLTSVGRQVLVQHAKSVTLENRSFPVRRTTRSRLREVDFQFESHQLRGLEQNPETASRWAAIGTPREIEGPRSAQYPAPPMKMPCFADMFRSGTASVPLTSAGKGKGCSSAQINGRAM